ncbi:MAG: rRNA maturation RNase YbeY [Candidatus Yonathbacteria bacterium]|nr:rRNA maturation RNase YbeY [Candidatus Yonathbacteria bacterium]
MLTITNKTKGKLPSLPFVKMKNAVLGKNYELSLVCIGNKASQRLNKTYRRKNTPTNILSFPLSKTEGEIFIDLKKSRAGAHLFERGYSNFIGFLFIHALLHLKGFDHGSKMEGKEVKLRKRFKI